MQKNQHGKPSVGTKDPTDRIGFLLLPRFSMMAFFSAVEPLRVANRLSERHLFSWHVFSVDGAPVEASNGMTLVADAAIRDVDFFPSVVVCASFEPERFENRQVLSWLRRLDRKGASLGAVDTGTHVLARAGLLDDYRVTLHWENLAGFREDFPEINATGELFEIDGRRFTAAGGTAPLDMMLHRIAARHGRDLAIGISEQLSHARIRNPDDHQRMAMGLRLGVRHPKLLRILEAMEQSLEEPLSPDELAAVGGISRRQLERLFRHYLGHTPTGYYLKLRLDRARQLLEQTDMSILEVGLASGFASAPYFSRAYKAQFGCPPREHRRRTREIGLAPQPTAAA